MIRVVRLGQPRSAGEGLRIGTVRRPPRGVQKDRFAKDDWYDVWFPTLAPSVEAMKLGQAADSAADWAAFTRHYRREMNEPAARHAIEVLAALSHGADFAVGCYCEDESRCHRSLLRELLLDAGARVAQGTQLPHDATTPPDQLRFHLRGAHRLLARRGAR